MARSEYVLNVGDDNVVLTRIVDRKVANAWLGSADPAMATEELGEALAEDPKAKISMIFDTLDQSFKEEEIPKVSVLDRRKVLARHIHMAFPGQNLRGARLVSQTDKKTLIYELASIPLDGRVPAWLDFIQSLPHPKGGIYTLAGENIDIVRALASKDAAPPETGNHWRHLIGINVTGGLRQIIEKNGRLCLTRLTQAPPPDTSPTDFAEMILRDFKATITYIRRLGYQVGEPLDVVMLTTAENKATLEDSTWDGARSVAVYTPYEAGLVLELGSLGREDQAYCDVLHAAWFASKVKPTLPLTRAAAMGDTKDDIRELAYLVAPYAAGVLAASLVGWTGWTGYQLYDYSTRNEILRAQLTGVQNELSSAQSLLGALPYQAEQVRNAIEVTDKLNAGRFDLVPLIQQVSKSLEGDAIVLSLKVFNGLPGAERVGGAALGPRTLALDVNLRLADVISTADEAVQTARRLERRLNQNFTPGYKVAMTEEPVGAQTSQQLTGGFGTGEMEGGAGQPESFFASFHIEKVTP